MKNMENGIVFSVCYSWANLSNTALLLILLRDRVGESATSGAQGVCQILAMF